MSENGKELSMGLTEMVGILVAGIRDGKDDEVLGMIASLDPVTTSAMLLTACMLLRTAMQFGTFPDADEMQVLAEVEDLLRKAGKEGEES